MQVEPPKKFVDKEDKFLVSFQNQNQNLKISSLIQLGVRSPHSLFVLHLTNRESDTKSKINSDYDTNWFVQVCVPDGLIEEDKLVEIKCPYKCSSASMETLAR